MIRGRRFGYVVLIVSGILFAPRYAVPAGTGDTAVTSAERAAARIEWTVTAETVARPGDALVVRIETKKKLTPPSVLLATPEGATVASTECFRIMPGKPDPLAPIDSATAYIAVLGLPSTLGPGTYRLHAEARIAGPEGEPLRSDTPLILESREFNAEEILLDGNNTKIKTDFGPERMSQIRALNEILFSRNQDAQRFSGPFASPVSQTRRTSEFGDRRLYRYADGETERNIHFGIDFGIPAGSPVFAAGDGRVVLAGFRISTGWTVVIEHLPGVYSLYYHLDRLVCTQGDRVKTGELIAQSGSTGLSTGPHLHWEFRVNGMAVSPDWFVGRTLY